MKVTKTNVFVGQTPVGELQVHAEEDRGNLSVFLDDARLDKTDSGIKHVRAQISGDPAAHDSYSTSVDLHYRGALGTGHRFSADLLRGELLMAGAGGSVDVVLHVEQGNTTKSTLLKRMSVADFLTGRAQVTKPPSE